MVIFAMAAVTASSSPAMNISMQRSVNTRAMTDRALRSASTNWVFWKSAMLAPKARRSAV